jgi:hypothetical protein
VKESIFVLRENAEKIMHVRVICTHARNLILAWERNIHVQDFLNALLFINGNQALKAFPKFSGAGSSYDGDGKDSERSSDYLLVNSMKTSLLFSVLALHLALAFAIFLIAQPALSFVQARILK